MFTKKKKKYLNHVKTKQTHGGYIIKFCGFENTRSQFSGERQNDVTGKMRRLQKVSLPEEASEDTASLLDHNGISTPLLGMKKKRLLLSQRTAYGVGHVLNDMCAAVWFSYTLLFFQVILGMQPVVAGIMLLIGELWSNFKVLL